MYYRYISACRNRKKTFKCISLVPRDWIPTTTPHALFLIIFIRCFKIARKTGENLINAVYGNVANTEVRELFEYRLKLKFYITLGFQQIQHGVSTVSSKKMRHVGYAHFDFAMRPPEHEYRIWTFYTYIHGFLCKTTAGQISSGQETVTFDSISGNGCRSRLQYWRKSLSTMRSFLFVSEA